MTVSSSGGGFNLAPLGNNIQEEITLMVSTITACDNILFPSSSSLKPLKKICVIQFCVREDIKPLQDVKRQDQTVSKKKNQHQEMIVLSYRAPHSLGAEIQIARPVRCPVLYCK